MTTKPGRPPLHDAKMIQRTYQITSNHDQAIKEIASDSEVSESSVVRIAIKRFAAEWNIEL